MINTAIEAATDIATTSFDPLAKLAKDIAAGAVLIAAVNAIVVGYLVLADRLGRPDERACSIRLRDAPIYLTVIVLARRHPRRHHGQGDHRPRDPDAGWLPFRSRRPRVRRLDGDHAS